VSWAWWDWPLTWLTNHRPSVLWCCWLGYLTHKIVSEMTYNVSSGTLNTTIPYYTNTIPVHGTQCSKFTSMISIHFWSCVRKVIKILAYLQKLLWKNQWHLFMYIFIFFVYTFITFFWAEPGVIVLDLVDNHCPSVLWNCLLGHRPMCRVGVKP